jgi:osmotically-inducible protein OsmY
MKREYGYGSERNGDRGRNRYRNQQFNRGTSLDDDYYGGESDSDRSGSGDRDRQYGQDFNESSRQSGRNMHYEQPQGDMENSRAYYGQSEPRPTRTGQSGSSGYGQPGRSNYGSSRYGGSDYQNGDFNRNESRYSTPHTEPSRRSSYQDSSYGGEMTGANWDRTSGSGEWRTGSRTQGQSAGQGQWGEEMGEESPYQKYESDYGQQNFGGGYSGQGSSGSYRTEPYQARGYEGKSYQGKGPKGYERSDERIREIVCEALTDDPRIDATEINVEVKNREIKLTGTVSDRRTKYAVEELIESKAHNCEIANELRIKNTQQNRSANSQSNTDYGYTQSAARGASMTTQNSSDENSASQSGNQFGKQGQTGKSDASKDKTKSNT